MNRARNTGDLNLGGASGMNGTNGMNVTGAGNRNENGGLVGGRAQNNGANARQRDNSLLEQIRQLSFVKVELELYLDTHPNCRVALDYYHQTVEALEKLMERYHASGSLVRAEGSQDPDSWEWVNTPWPWHRGDEKLNGWREER